MLPHTVLQRQVRNLGTCYAASGTAKQSLLRLSTELVQHLQAVAAPAAIQQHGQVLRQRATEMDFWGRDQVMAANLAWVLEQEPAAKVVVWAHNDHLRRDADQLRMGQCLTKQLGPAYVALGFATGHGTASVSNPDRTVRPLVLAPPLANCFEKWLDQAALPNYFFNLQRAASDKWLTTRRKFRVIGYNERPGGTNGQFVWYPPLPSAFDGLFYLHETSASQPYQTAHPAR